MNTRELIEEHTQFLGVYRARISRAEQVLREYDDLRRPLVDARVKAENDLTCLYAEWQSADKVIAEYTTKIEATHKTIRELRSSRGITKDSPKQSKLQKLMRLKRKLDRMIDDDPEMAELFEEC